MAIDSMLNSRRQFLVQSSALVFSLALPLSAESEINTRHARLLAAWQLPNGAYQVGVLNAAGKLARFLMPCAWQSICQHARMV